MNLRKIIQDECCEWLGSDMAEDFMKDGVIDAILFRFQTSPEYRRHIAIEGDFELDEDLLGPLQEAFLDVALHI